MWSCHNAVLGSTTEFPCGIQNNKSSFQSTNQPAEITWTFNDRIINQTSRIHVSSDGSLKIEQVRNTDVGVYTCRVALPDNMGNITRTTKLEVIELPHAPFSVKTELNVAGGLVNVSWNAPFDGNSVIKRYVVESRVIRSGGDMMSNDDLSYNEGLNGWNRYNANISTHQRFALLTNLKPAMTYQFRVLAVNDVGEGPPSIPSNPPVVIPAQPPAASPMGVVGAPRSSTSIIIQWQPPPQESHNGYLLGYLVRYKLAGYADTQWYTINVTNAAQYSCLLEDLIVWRNYEIQIAAYNDMGVGSYSQSIFIRTREGRPAAAPRDVEASALNSTSIVIKWNQTDPQLINGLNLGYKIQAHIDENHKNPTFVASTESMDGRHFDSSSSAPVTMRPRKTASSLKLAKETTVSSHPHNQDGYETIFTDLEPYTTYIITVKCFTSAGDGPPNEPAIYVTTNEDLPDHLASFKFLEVKDISVDVIWSPPEKINGKLLGYTLKYCSAPFQSCEFKTLNYGPEATSASVNHLKPDTSYLFEINAVTRIGSGPVLSATIKSSVAPVEIGDLMFSDITMNRLRVSWAPPIMNVNTTLKGYHVVYESQGDFGKQVIQKIADHYLVVTGLKERATYTFKVRAETQTGLGPERVGLITTGPQPGSPLPPLSVNLTQTLTSVRLKWYNTPHQPEPLVGYLIEGRQVFGVESPNSVLSTAASDEESQWQPIRMLRNGPQSEYDLPFSLLSPSSKYTLRIFSINSKGISEPAFPMISGSQASRNDSNARGLLQTIIITPSHLAQLRARLPFYKEPWFVILTASMTVVFTIMVIAILCVQSKTYQYKKEAHNNINKHNGQPFSGSRDALSEAGFGIMHDEGPYATGLELRSQNHHMNGQPGVRRSNVALNEQSAAAAARAPPRPAPGSLSYSDEEDMEYCDDTEAKESNLYGSSGDDSLTEKPSELSSSGPESESDEMDQGAHFVNHYANVNDTLRKGNPSWKRQGHPYTVRPPDHKRRDRNRSMDRNRERSMDRNTGRRSRGDATHPKSDHHYRDHSRGRSSNNDLYQSTSRMGHHSQQHLYQAGPSGAGASNHYAQAAAAAPSPTSMSHSNQNLYGPSTSAMSQHRPNRPAPPIPGRDNIGAPPSYLSAVNHNLQLHHNNGTSSEASDQLDSPTVSNLNGGRIIVNNMAGSRAPLPGFSSFV